MAQHVYYGGEYLGRIATWSEITRKVLQATACGAEGNCWNQFLTRLYWQPHSRLCGFD